MNQRKATALRKALGKRWYSDYEKQCTAAGITPCGMKKIKKLARGVRITQILDGSFLEFVEDKTFGY